MTNSTENMFITTADVCAMTGWSKDHIYRLCRQGILPYISSKPHRFLPEQLIAALTKMQSGGVYGKKTHRRRKK